ncbi:MAG: sodium:calcium antiporter, partial [Candidatus Neomarinimicrobiota bacterium]
MILSIFYLTAGTAMLYFGAEWLVKSGSNLASRAGIPKLVIGLTLIAFGTSLPELIVSIVAVLEGSSSIAIGNVVGSNIANVGLVLGVSSLIFPISIYFEDLKLDFYLYLGVCALFILFIFDGRLSRFEGFVLFLCILFYLQLCLKH